MAEAQKDDWLEELAEVREQEGEEYQAEGEHPAEEQAEAKPEPEPEPEPKEDKIPLATLLETRNKMQARIDGLEGTNKDLMEKFAILTQKIEEREAKEAEVPAPDYLDDPKAYIDHTQKSVVDRLRSFEDQLNQANKATEEASQQITQQQQIQQIQQAAGAMEQTFAEKTPDYWNALDHIRQVRQQQLKMAFPDADDAQIAQHIAGEEFMTAAQLIQQNRNPAEYAYQYARTIGYTAAKPEAQPNEDLEARKEAAQGMGGSGEDAGPDVEALADMDMPEFHQAMKEMFG